MQLSDQDNLGDFLESAGVPATDTTPAPDTSTPPTDLSRDPETGRFAPKQGDEPTVQDTPVEAAPATPAAVEPKQQTVPLDAITAIRAENRELKQMLQQLMGSQQKAAEPQPQPKGSFWDDPEAYLEQKLQSVSSNGSAMTRQVSEMMAVQQFGADVVDAAGKALLEEAQTNPATRFDYERIMASRHPYAELVSWHKRHQTLSKIGDNPDAFVDAEVERRMADPQFQAKMLERIRGTASTQQPITQVPPSLNRIPAGANAPTDGPMDDAGLFAFATQGMRR
jgi:hypothetical protein